MRRRVRRQRPPSSPFSQCTDRRSLSAAKVMARPHDARQVSSLRVAEGRAERAQSLCGSLHQRSNSANDRTLVPTSRDKRSRLLRSAAFSVTKIARCPRRWAYKKRAARPYKKRAARRWLLSASMAKTLSRKTFSSLVSRSASVSWYVDCPPLISASSATDSVPAMS
jgi:hypothetical protein